MKASNLRESDSLEFKRSVSKTFCASVVAFANTSGGTILIGVDDNGAALGVENPDETMLRASSAIVDSVCPDILPFVSICTREIDDTTVVEIVIEEGDRKPYCLASKGFTPAGIYLRTGSGNVHAGIDAIRSMIRASDGDSFETRRCENQSLTFDSLRTFLAEAGLTCTQENLKTIHAKNLDGSCTNLGLLLSDQCPFSIKCAVYDDNDGLDYRDRWKFEGSVLSQMEDALEFLDLTNTLHASFNGLRRTEAFAVPPRALREALINAVMHRDYDYNAPVIINVFSDRIEFVSIGGLVKGVSLEDVMAGVSATRNPLFADILERLNMVEGYGMGIRIMKSLYKGTGLQPRFEANPESFVAVLPKRRSGGAATANETASTTFEETDGIENALAGETSDANPKRETAAGRNAPQSPLAENAQLPPISVRDRKQAERSHCECAVVQFAQEHGEVRRADVENLLGISRDAALVIIEALAHKGLLEKRGKSRGTHYIPAAR